MIDWTKPIQTKAGEPAELLFTYSTEARYTRLCVLGKETRGERVNSYTEDGRLYFGDESTQDIINVPEEMVLAVISLHKSGGIDFQPYQYSPRDCAYRITIKQTGDKVTAEVEEA